MRMSIGALSLAIATLAGGAPLEAQQLREDSYTWYIAPQGGMLFFETQTQSSSGIPTFGVQAMIVGKRGGLMLSWEEGFGSDETSAFADPTATNNARDVTFDRLRKYSAILMAFPLRSRVEPYLGVGFGIMHTVGTDVGGVFTDPAAAGAAQEQATDLGSTGFGSLVGGLQFRISPKLVLYGQYQATTSPASGKLLVGPTHTIVGGIRLGLGSAKEGIQGGGY